MNDFFAVPLPDELRAGLRGTALAFRGYNVTNLGRSSELLAHPAYAPVVKQYLTEASRICSELTDKKTELLRRVREGREASLRNYAEALALVVAMEFAHMRILRDQFDIDVSQARLAFGYSLGELSAVGTGGLFSLEDVLTVPIRLAGDCVALAQDVTMGIIFSRGPALVEDDVHRLCLRITAEGRGVVAISAVLSPNSLLLLGQRASIRRFAKLMYDLLPRAVHLRINPHRWPPLHTPIVWQRNIPNRAGVMLQNIPIGPTAATPEVVTLIDGKTRYGELNTRDLLQRWSDHPQRLWDAVYETLSAKVTNVIHIGPEPNLIPATFKRLSDNVRQQVSGRSLGSIGRRAVSGMARRPWLGALLPTKTSLFRAPHLRHVILEDWLLARAPD